MSKQIKQRVEPQTNTASDANSEQVPFFVRRLQKLPTFKSGVRGGQECGVDDE